MSQQANVIGLLIRARINVVTDAVRRCLL